MNLQTSIHNKNNSVQAMIFAAGLGTRFKPWTDNHPKALALVNGKSLLQRNIEYLRQYGIDSVLVNVHHFADQVKEALALYGGWGSRVTISDETDQLLETGGGLKKAIPLFTEPTIVVMNADILTSLNLDAIIRDHREKNSMVTLAVSKRETSRYFLFNPQGRLCGWRNTRTGEEKIAKPDRNLIPLAFSGLQVISSNLFPLIKEEGKFSLVDLYLRLAPDHSIRAFDHTGVPVIDVGKPEAIARAEALFP